MIRLDEINESAETGVGSYFVANYPPFSVWSKEFVPDAHRILDQRPRALRCFDPQTMVEDAAGRCASPPPLGLYLHIPFCRTRCKFCYFRVFTDKNSKDIEEYLSAMTKEVAWFCEREALYGRDFQFVYFGGGTPSYLSSDQLNRMADSLRSYRSWDKAQEVTFECEPGTLKKSKLETLRRIGVTRLSLGIEHFDDSVLELNGRAHRSAEVFHAFSWAKEVGFPQINIDLIAGMLGDDEVKWRDTVEKAAGLGADSVTIYQMETPHNTLMARDARAGSGLSAPSWPTKRAWASYAFDRLEAQGYEVSSAYTLMKKSCGTGFVYRDSIWRGADMIGTGVASFSHVDGVHFQNDDSWDGYLSTLLETGVAPIARALTMTARQRMIRELVLQLKLGRVQGAYFRRKFGVDICSEFASPIEQLGRQGYMTEAGGDLTLKRDGLLRIDALAPEFFENQFRDVRYT